MDDLKRLTPVQEQNLETLGLMAEWFGGFFMRQADRIIYKRPANDQASTK